MSDMQYPSEAIKGPFREAEDDEDKFLKELE